MFNSQFVPDPDHAWRMERYLALTSVSHPSLAALVPRFPHFSLFASNITTASVNNQNTLREAAMGALKYLEELQKRKQSTFRPFKFHGICWQ